LQKLNPKPVQAQHKKAATMPAGTTPLRQLDRWLRRVNKSSVSAFLEVVADI